MDHLDLKHDILRLAGLLGSIEVLSAADSRRSLREIVAMAVANATPVTVALIAVELAIRIDAG